MLVKLTPWENFVNILASRFMFVIHWQNLEEKLLCKTLVKLTHECKGKNWCRDKFLFSCPFFTLLSYSTLLLNGWLVFAKSWIWIASLNLNGNPTKQEKERRRKLHTFCSQINEVWNFERMAAKNIIWF